MSDPVLRLPIESSFNESGARSAEAWLKRLRALEQQKPAGGGPSSYDQQAAAAARAATAQQKLATETQRTAATSNQAAVAAQRLATEEQRTATATAQAAAAHTRAEQAALRYAQAQEKVARSSQQASSGVAVLPRTIAGLSHEAATAATTLLGVGTAMAAVGKGVELAQIGAQASLVETRFEGMAQAAGQSGDAILGALRKASGGEISDLNLQLAANKSALLGVATSADQLSVFMEIARDRAQAMGISTQFAFDSIITGLGRGSALILDNIGITVEAGEVNAAYAASIGKTVAQLSEAEKKQALINAVVAQGRATLAATGGAADSAAGDFAAMGAASENAQASIGKLLAQLGRMPAQVVTEVLVKVSDGIQQLADGEKKLEETQAKLLEVSSSFDDYAQKLNFVNSQLAPLGASVGAVTEEQFAFAQSLIKSGDSATEAMAKVREYGGAIQAGTQAQSDWGAASGTLASQMLEIAGTSEGNKAAILNLSQAYNDGNISASTLEAAVAQLSAMHDIASEAAAQEAREQRNLSGAHFEATTAIDAASVAMAENTQKSLDASLATQELAAFQATLADLGGAVAGGLMTAGNAAIILAGQYNIATGEALRLIQAQAALGQAKVNAQAFADQRAGERSGGAFRTVDEVNRVTKAERLQAESQRRRAAEAKKETDAQMQADLAIARAKGDQAGQVALLRQQQQGLNKSSAEYKQIEASILSLQKQKGVGGGRAGGGAGGTAASRAKAAEQTGERLADIERQGGQKIADINEQTQQKLAAIEAKYAEQRAAAQRQLMDEIARANASTNFDQQLNDFDQFAKDLTDEQKGALADREAAEADYNSKVAGYQEEARQQAASGDAKLAEDILAARTEQAKKEKEIAERAAEARRAGGNAAAVAAEAQQATDAARAQAETEIAIANAKAAERAGAEQAEKDAVVAAAQEQAAKVVEAAEESARKVKGASDGQRSTVIANLQAQAAAFKAWADSVVSDSNRAGAAVGAVTGPPVSAPGEGGTEAGDGAAGGGAPGGAGLAGMRTAGSGGGGSVASAIQTLNDAAEIIKVIKPFVAANAGAVKLLNEYSLTVKSAVGSLLAIQDLRDRLVKPQPVLDPAQVTRLKADIEFVLAEMIKVDVSATNKVRVLAKYLELEKAAVDILTTALDLRNALAEPTPPIDRAYAMTLFQETSAVANDLIAAMPKMVQREIDNLKAYRDGSGAAIAILNDSADLAATLAEPRPIIPPGSIRKIAELTAQTTRVVLALLVPLMERETQALERYQTAALAAVEVITATAELPKLLAEPKPAIPPGSIKKLAELALQVLRVVTAVMQPTAEETVAAMERYTSTAGAAISLITEAAELPEVLAKARPAVAVGAIKAIAADAKRVTQIVLSELIPVGEEQSEAAQRYADTAGAAIGLIKDVTGLSGEMFTDYVSPTDAQLDMIVTDADRLVLRLNRAAAKYSTEGLEATKAYGDALGSVFTSFKDQLLFAQALQSDDFVLDPKKLAAFERGGEQIIAVAGRLGSQAAALPAGNLAALNGVSEAVNAQSDMWLKLASVPFGNLGQLASGAGGAGGNSITVHIHNPPANMDIGAVRRQIEQGIRQTVASRR